MYPITHQRLLPAQSTVPSASITTEWRDILRRNDLNQMATAVERVLRHPETCPDASTIHEMLRIGITGGKSLDFLQQIMRLPNFNIGLENLAAPIQDRNLITIAAGRGDLGLCRLLLKHGADPARVDPNATCSNSMKYLLRTAQVIHDIQFHLLGEGSDPLHRAILNFDPTLIKAKLERLFAETDPTAPKFLAKSCHRYMQFAKVAQRRDVLCATLALAKPEWGTGDVDMTHASLCQHLKNLVAQLSSAATSSPQDSGDDPAILDPGSSQEQSQSQSSSRSEQLLRRLLTDYLA